MVLSWHIYCQDVCPPSCNQANLPPMEACLDDVIAGIQALSELLDMIASSRQGSLGLLQLQAELLSPALCSSLAGAVSCPHLVPLRSFLQTENKCLDADASMSVIPYQICVQASHVSTVSVKWMMIDLHGHVRPDSHDKGFCTACCHPARPKAAGLSSHPVLHCQCQGESK